MDNHIIVAFLLFASVLMVQNSHAMKFSFGNKNSHHVVVKRDPAQHAKVEITVINGHDRASRLVVTDQDYDIITQGKVSSGNNLTWTAKIGPHNYQTENHTCHVFFVTTRESGSFPVFNAEETYFGNGIGAQVEIIWRVNPRGADEKDLDSGNFVRKFSWPSD